MPRQQPRLCGTRWEQVRVEQDGRREEREHERDLDDRTDVAEEGEERGAAQTHTERDHGPWQYGKRQDDDVHRPAFFHEHKNQCDRRKREPELDRRDDPAGERERER